MSKWTERQHPPHWQWCRLLAIRCNTMTPVCCGVQLPSEANAIVAAVNGALAPRLDGIKGQTVMLAGQMTSLGSDVVGECTGQTSRPVDE